MKNTKSVWMVADTVQTTKISCGYITIKCEKENVERRYEKYVHLNFMFV